MVGQIVAALRSLRDRRDVTLLGDVWLIDPEQRSEA
jgi:hypothetical protein